MLWIIAGFSHETNTFSRVSTGLEAFHTHGYFLGEEMRRAFQGTRTVVGGFMDAIAELGDSSHFTVSARSTPSGMVTRETYEEISGRILDGVKEHPEADGILLSLHGAMVADGIDDGEGDLLGRIRTVVGTDMPITAVLDLHAHLTEMMTEQADLLIGYQKYPHTDQYERGFETARLISQIASGKIHPRHALSRVPLLPPASTCHTEEGLFKDLWARALRHDRPEEVLTTSLFADFPGADLPEMGFSVLVYADDAKTVAQEEADRLSKTAWERRHEFVYRTNPIPRAVTQALSIADRPVVLADNADNPGGGSANDSVEILRELLKQGAKNAVIATVYDPDVVKQCFDIGIGNPFRTELGAKTDGLHGRSLEVEGSVGCLSDGRFQYRGAMSGGMWGDLGPSAVLNVNENQVIVTSHRVQARDPGIFEPFGIDPLKKSILVLKSSVHFRASFKDIAKRFIIADGPGLTSMDLSQFPYRRIKRPIFPLDDM